MTDDAERLRWLSGDCRSKGSPQLADELRQIADRMEVEAKVADVGRKLVGLVVNQRPDGFWKTRITSLRYGATWMTKERAAEDAAEYYSLDPSAILTALEPAK